MKWIESLSSFAGKYFALLVIVAAITAFLVPEVFIPINGYVPILLGIVMLGMGMTLKPVDFKLVATRPLPVLLGLVFQFTIMPFTASRLLICCNCRQNSRLALCCLVQSLGAQRPTSWFIWQKAIYPFQLQ